jgi:hypothetical protein
MRLKRQVRLRRKKILKHWYYCFIYLFITSLVVTGVSFSRFSTSITNTGAENINVTGTGPATPDIVFSTWVIDHGAATVSLANLAPGDTKTIAIWVSNKNSSGKVSGYNQNVTLELKTTGNLPLSYTLQKEDGTQVVLNHPDTYRYVSESQAFLANTEETKSYILTVSWPGSSNNHKYSNEIDYIELKLTAVQA